MLAPVRTVAPAGMPVSLAEAKAHLRVDHDDEDTIIMALFDAAVGYLDGWTGILGQCLEEQEWRQDFDGFSACLRLPLWPVISVSSLVWRNAAGQVATVPSDDYALKSDARGAYVRFRNDFVYPGDLYETGAVFVTYSAGYPRQGIVEADPNAEPPVEADPGTSTVPAPIKAAILLLVGHWYQNREAVAEGSHAVLPMAADALVSPYRRVDV